MKLLQELGDQLDIGAGRMVRAGQVKLDAIAGAQDDRVATVAHAQLVEGRGNALR